MNTIVIAEDQVNVRQGVRDMIEDEPDLTVVGEAGGGPETMRLVIEVRPDILVLDLSLGDANGMDIAGCVQNSFPETDVVIYSMYGYTSYLLKARRLGVRGYVVKKSPPYELVKAIKAVLAGGHYFVPPLPQDFL